MARTRDRARRDWPTGLRESRPGYFMWDNPDTGTSMAIGRVGLSDAKQQAIEANAWLAQQRAQVRLVDRLNGQTLTLEQWLTDWADRLEKKGELAKNTIKSYRSVSRAIAGEIGAVPVGRLTVRDVAEALEDIEEERGERTAQAARSVLKTALTAAMAKGHIDFNPALSTEAITVQVKRQRFTWETFSKVWQQLQDAPAWVRNATALALVSGQRREDVAAATFADFDDELWRCTQIKTGHKLAIPLDLRLDVFGMSLRDVLTACRRTGVVSRHLIHQVKPYGNSPVGSAIFVDTITKRFTEAVEAALGPADNLPTLHELRSLCKRLYTTQGGVDTKALLGHATDAMGQLYNDARGAEYERVKLG